jgi:hypothetical protein
LHQNRFEDTIFVPVVANYKVDVGHVSFSVSRKRIINYSRSISKLYRMIKMLQIIGDVQGAIAIVVD